MFFLKKALCIKKRLFICHDKKLYTSTIYSSYFARCIKTCTYIFSYKVYKYICKSVIFNMYDII